MNQKNKKSLVLWDPIYKEIIFDYKIKRIIDTAVFQRLRRIKQTGGLEYLFPGATHTRFSHSCGTYHLSTILLSKNKLFSEISAYDKLVLSISCLLHDIGHGPLSHFFERITNISHEKYSQEFILHNKELNGVLKDIHKDLPRDIVDTLQKKYHNNIINLLLSSNIDLDRMDYLMRDSYYCGVNIGTIDYQWIISNIKYKNDKIYFPKKVASSVEIFLINRYYMYKQVYLHRSARAFDGMILLIFKRIRFLQKVNYQFKFDFLKNNSFKKMVANEKLSVDEYLYLDDYNFMSFLRQFEFEDDKILNLLIKSLFLNKLFKPRHDINKKDLDKYRIDNFNLYFFEHDTLNPFTLNSFRSNPIYIKSSENIYHKLEDQSFLIKGIIGAFKSDFFSTKILFIPPDIKEWLL